MTNLVNFHPLCVKEVLFYPASVCQFICLSVGSFTCKLLIRSPWTFHWRCICGQEPIKFCKSSASRGATTAEKLTGTKVWVPSPGRLRPAPGQRPNWLLGAGGGRPLPLSSPPAVRIRGYHPPGKLLTTQMLNPAFWWPLAVKYLAFWKLRPRISGTNTLLVPKPKSWGPVSPGRRSLRLLRLWLLVQNSSTGLIQWIVVNSKL